ncbi:hypothetical protein DL764_010477 [Monosporascus ibericus]|uniref:alpha-1,2-Mannosidase n=1 Tax=Monosporascus ibericus TaxID=155417 RepID=A0A4Q4SSK5_9PEZI|nr:hypothetical protein DL764_010477 [Monosporascus ibericus]
MEQFVGRRPPPDFSLQVGRDFIGLTVFIVSQNSDPWDSLGGKFSYARPPNSNTDYTATFDESETIEKIKNPTYGNHGASGSYGTGEDADAGPERELNKIKIPELKENDDVSDAASGGDSRRPLTKPTPEEKGEEKYGEDEDGADDATPAKTTPAPVVDIPDRKVNYDNKGGLDDEKTVATTSVIHWEKVPEHFPVPTESIITLPTGKPEKIPTIQYQFKQESAEAREKRLARLRMVEAEARRAWAGYKKYAWMHDELSPVSRKFRDPFCGWAATLVDSLDTLWIMGMKDEFDDAVKAVGDIDFTTSSRNEIPVFETTIRYLGGLIAAYDVSGGKAGGYTVLLDKAVELAEILMGVFDTPNRMPVLYYNWKPAFASLPKRASTGAGLAELGSLSMEFTRLAQLTKDDKYYDAVARITDALHDWQKRGTTIPGIFPDRVDASGCNKTAEAELASQRAAKLAESQEVLADSSESRPIRPFGDKTDISSSYQGPRHEQGPNSDSNQGGSESGGLRPLKRRSDAGEEKRSYESLTAPSNSLAADESTPKQLSSPNQARSPGQTECVPQGLTAGQYGLESYSMGGAQDSAYEYFPKQYLLLGGLEPKYRTMHLKVVEAVKKSLLFRPMVPDDRDMLFSAKITTRGNFPEDAVTEFEIAHLTCFLGGMFGLGGKIFDQPMDVEIGKKLADGCVWAYESTASGIMPEGASAVACESVNNCHWNETAWWRVLDPLADTREAELADYNARKEELEAIKTQQEKRKKLAAEAKNRVAVGTGGEDELSKEHIAGSGDAGWGDKVTGEDDESSSVGGSTSKLREGRITGRSVPEANGHVEKRLPPPPPDKNADRSKLAGPPASDDTSTPTKTTNLKDALDMNEGNTIERDADQIPLQVEPIIDDPARPQSHKEYVQHRIETEKLPPGFSNVLFPNYILRPEAIESVWYMYRITGDTTWQEKGWRMFEAIIRNTQTEAGHSAIDDVMSPNPGKTNAMESFWIAETLKYFYLLYSAPDLMSLDEWVLNTEAHFFKRPT